MHIKELPEITQANRVTQLARKILTVDTSTRPAGPWQRIRALFGLPYEMVVTKPEWIAERAIEIAEVYLEAEEAYLEEARKRDGIA